MSKNMFIIKGVNMKVLFIFAMLASFSFAVKPVPKNDDDRSDKASVKKVQVVDEDKNAVKVKETNDNKNNDRKVEVKNKPKNVTGDNADKFIDADSNKVNDSREDDFWKIKQLGTKLKNLIKKDHDNRDNKKDEPQKPDMPIKKKSGR